MLVEMQTAAADDTLRDAPASPVPGDEAAEESSEEGSGDAPWTTDPDEWPPHFGAARLGIP